jgi:peptidoglycan/xylan/chitin deacetylase (PgdA/CDA1 family)
MSTTQQPQFAFRDVPGPPRDMVGYGRTPPRVRWPGDARVAVNLVVNYEEGSEYSLPAGDTRVERMGELGYPWPELERDLFCESVYQYGSRAGIWRLQRMFDAFDVPCTFFGCAVAFELTPEVGDYVRAADHDVCCHGWRWEEIYRLDPETERRHLRAAIESIERTCGSRPLGWYSRNPSVKTRELLVEEGGFVYDADAHDDDLPYFTEVSGTRHLVVPYSFVYNDSRFLPGQGYSDPTSFYDHCRRGLDYLWDEGATHPRMMSIGLHPRWIGQAGRASALRDFIEYALEKGDVWFARRIDIANWWIAHHEEFR